MDRKISENSGPTTPFTIVRARIFEMASTFAPECRQKLEAQSGGYGGQAVGKLSPVLHGTRSWTTVDYSQNFRFVRRAINGGGGSAVALGFFF